MEEECVGSQVPQQTVALQKKKKCLKIHDIHICMSTCNRQLIYYSYFIITVLLLTLFHDIKRFRNQNWKRNMLLCVIPSNPASICFTLMVFVWVYSCMVFSNGVSSSDNERSKSGQFLNNKLARRRKKAVILGSVCASHCEAHRLKIKEYTISNKRTASVL